MLKRFKLFVPVFLVASATVRGQSTPNPPEWGPLARLNGAWDGQGSGKFGLSTVQIEYETILDGCFLQGRLHSVYEPQERNPDGEVHKNWDVYGFDQDRGRWVMRQFHTGGIVIAYALDKAASSDDELVFVSEHIDNIATVIGAGWRARQTLRFTGANEYVEIFELAGPGEDFTVAVETRLTRRE